MALAETARWRVRRCYKAMKFWRRNEKMAQSRQGTKSRFLPSNNVIHAAAVLASASLWAQSGYGQATLLYQWNFDGPNPAVPTVSAGGGTLGITNSTDGQGAFSSTGGISGGMLDLSSQQFATADPSSYASTETSGNALTGLGTQNDVTITMWYKTNPTGNALAANNVPRLLNLGASPGYDPQPAPPSGPTPLGSGMSIQLQGGATDGSSKYNIIPADQTSGTNTNVDRPSRPDNGHYWFGRSL